MGNLIVVSFKLEKELADLLEAYASSHNMTKSEVIRRALRAYISAERAYPRPWKGKYLTIF